MTQYEMGDRCEPAATEVRADARHFMRVLAGRASSPELALVHGDATARDALAATRVPF